MKAINLTITLLSAALLIGLAACNKPPADEPGSTASAGAADVQAEGEHAGGSVALPPLDAVEQPCTAEAGTETDGAASARRFADFKMRHASGEVKPISEFYGKPLVVNFWGDWCGPCIEELPAMDAIYRERKSEFEMIAVSVDSKAAEDFWKQNSYEIPMYHDVDGRSLLGLSAIPTTFFIDRDGGVVGFISGSMSREDFEIHLATIL